MDKTILIKIGVSDEIVKKWLKGGLKISYPMIKNKKYYISEDGIAFVENGDKYVIPLSKKEVTTYTKNPKIFKNDFLKSAKFYVTFVNWLHKLQTKIDPLKPKEKFTSLLLILYLFQRAMDHHYYHFDRYLVYQNYSDTPVGFWWKKMQDICQIISQKEKIDSDILFLKLLSKDEQSPIQYKNILTSVEFNQLLEALRNIRIFEDTQEAEVDLIIDKKTRENILFRTAVPIWNDLMDLLKKYPDVFKADYKIKISEITEGHPLIITRLILSTTGLNYLRPDIFAAFKNEIKRWID